MIDALNGGVAVIHTAAFCLVVASTAAYALAKLPFWCVGMWRLLHDPRAKHRVGDSPHHWWIKKRIAQVEMVQDAARPGLMVGWIVFLAPWLIGSIL